MLMEPFYILSTIGGVVDFFYIFLFFILNKGSSCIMRAAVDILGPPLQALNLLSLFVKGIVGQVIKNRGRTLLFFPIFNKKERRESQQLIAEVHFSNGLIVF